jgi:hypothetical protein
VVIKDSSRDDGSYRVGSPNEGVAILFAIFAAVSMYLAIVNVLVSPDAAAAAPASSLTRPSAAPASNPPVSARQSPASNAFDQDSERVDDSHECRPSAGIDSQRIYD